LKKIISFWILIPEVFPNNIALLLKLKSHLIILYFITSYLIYLFNFWLGVLVSSLSHHFNYFFIKSNKWKSPWLPCLILLLYISFNRFFKISKLIWTNLSLIVIYFILLSIAFLLFEFVLLYYLLLSCFIVIKCLIPQNIHMRMKKEGAKGILYKLTVRYA